MFNPKTNSKEANEAAISCNIVAGTVITGKVTSSENIRLDGEIRGDVTCDKKLVMGTSGKILGKTIAENLFALGRIEGDVHIKEIIELSGDAYVKGAIHAKKLTVQEGARYDGECRIG